MAMQHRNYVEEIWVTLDKDMKVVPVNALSNLLRDYYHRQSLRKVHKKHGVQASTIRSHYTSLNVFIQFLKNQQV